MELQETIDKLQERLQLAWTGRNFGVLCKGCGEKDFAGCGVDGPSKCDNCDEWVCLNCKDNDKYKCCWTGCIGYCKDCALVKLATCKDCGKDYCNYCNYNDHDDHDDDIILE